MSLLKPKLSNIDRVAAFAARDCCAHYPAKHFKLCFNFKMTANCSGIFVQMPVSIFVYQIVNLTYPEFSPSENY